MFTRENVLYFDGLGLLLYREHSCEYWGVVISSCLQSVTCLATDARLTADPGVASLIPAWSHTFVEIDHEIISTVFLLPSADSFKKGLLSVTSESMCTNYWLTACSSLPRKSVVRWADRLAMTIAVDLGRKATKTNKNKISSCWRQTRWTTDIDWSQ